MMNNLYKDGKQKLYRKSFCAFVDILGFSQKIANEDLSFFNQYLKVLDKELEYFEEAFDLSNKEGYKSFELKIFTDNFVFGHPWNEESGESELGNIFQAISHLQLTLVQSGIFLRGAVTISNLFMDENIVLGPALVEAYKLESEKALYPRIIVSEEVKETVKKHIEFYAKDFSPQQNEYLVDIDGYTFLNYLDCMFYYNPTEEDKIRVELINHKKPIIDNLELNKNDFKLYSKYAWVAKYHNYFCDNFLHERHPNIDLNEVKIEEDFFSKKIQRVI